MAESLIAGRILKSDSEDKRQDTLAQQPGICLFKYASPYISKSEGCHKGYDYVSGLPVGESDFAPLRILGISVGAVF